MKRAIRQQLKGAFIHCRWCGGFGCLGCDEERRRYEEQRSQPIFTADVNDPDDMEALRRVVGRPALERAFGPDGGGVHEIEYNAAVETLMQVLRKTKPGNAEAEEAEGTA